MNQLTQFSNKSMELPFTAVLSWKGFVRDSKEMHYTVLIATKKRRSRGACAPKTDEGCSTLVEVATATESKTAVQGSIKREDFEGAGDDALPDFPA